MDDSALKAGEVVLDVATPADAALLSNLLELYIHDLSETFPNILWRRLPGTWTVRVSEGDASGLRFWPGVIAEFARGGVTESERPGAPHPWRVFRFESA